MRLGLSLSRSDTNTTPDYWLSKPLTECMEWIDVITKVQKEEEKRQKARK